MTKQFLFWGVGDEPDSNKLVAENEAKYLMDEEFPQAIVDPATGVWVMKEEEDDYYPPDSLRIYAEPDFDAMEIGKDYLVVLNFSSFDEENINDDKEEREEVTLDEFKCEVRAEHPAITLQVIGGAVTEDVVGWIRRVS